MKDAVLIFGLLIGIFSNVWAEELHNPPALEVFEGHIHHQANIQLIQTQNSFLIQIDFPTSDLQVPNDENFTLIRTPEKIFQTENIKASCELTRTQFEKKTLEPEHSDYLMTFEYACKEPATIESIDFNPLFNLPTTLETAKASVIIGDQVLPSVEIKKGTAILKFKKSK
ncbi:MAG: hypothetical protein KDD46_07320 [Bdellovibrionales bacterium]|nr:hypothetical protein [Bdellovibrionales bacterium]